MVRLTNYQVFSDKDYTDTGGPLAKKSSKFVSSLWDIKNPHTVWEEYGMEFPVLWLSFVSVWEGGYSRSTSAQ